MVPPRPPPSASRTGHRRWTSRPAKPASVATAWSTDPAVYAAQPPRLTDEDMASMRSPTPPERVRFLPSVLHTPRSSSRPGCRSLTPVTRVRTPLGALLDATVVSGRKHTALPALRTGFESRRSLSHGALGGQDGGLHPPERGSIPRGSISSADREPLPRFSIARIPEGVPCRGRNCRLVRKHRTSRCRCNTRSRTRLVARLGCLPGGAGSTPVESADSS